MRGWMAAAGAGLTSLVLLAALASSAATLTVDGGVLQVFTYPVNLRPEPPSDLTCRILDWFHAELRWSPTDSPAEGYRVYHKSPWPHGGGFSLLAEVPDASATSYDELMPSLLRHSYLMTSYLSGLESEPSETIKIHCRPRVTHFPGPCGVEGENHHSQRTVELSWDAVAGAVSYGVLRGTASGGPYELLTTTDVPAYTDTAVADGVTYYYVVVAVDAVGNESDPSVEVAVADVAPIPTPTSTWMPTATPTLEPTSTTEPAATPTPTPMSTPTLTPTPEVPPTPQLTATPTPTSTAVPEPTGTTETASTPVATWEPTPTPLPTVDPISTVVFEY